VLIVIVGNLLWMMTFRASRQEELDTELLRLVRMGTVQEVKDVLDQGADPNARDVTSRTQGISGWFDSVVRGGRSSSLVGGATALGYAVSEKQSYELTKLLLDRGANPREPSTHEPLFWAARAGEAKTVRLLLDKGLDPNSVDSVGMTPLRGAVLSGNVDTVRLLVERGARGSFDVIGGETMMDAAKRVGAPEVVKILKDAGLKN
jgi:ankyrin repeat protein